MKKGSKLTSMPSPARFEHRAPLRPSDRNKEEVSAPLAQHLLRAKHMSSLDTELNWHFATRFCTGTKSLVQRGLGWEEATQEGRARCPDDAIH